MSLQTFQADLAAVQSSISSVPSLSNASVSFLATLSAQISAAQQDGQELVTVMDKFLDLLGDNSYFSAGLSPEILVQNMVAIEAYTYLLPFALDSVARLTRMGKTVAGITS